MAEVDPVILRLVAENSKYQSDMRNTTTVVQAQLDKQGAAVDRLERKMDSGFKRIGSSALRGATALKSAIAGIGLVALGAQAVETAIRFTRFEKGLEVATGSAANAGEEIKFLREMADSLGVRFITLAENFTGIAAAARGTSLEGQKTRDVFESITKAIIATGGSSEQVNGALLAVQQMMSKGNVQAEELRGQLGERLPGAFQIAARAMGVTTAQLNKMLEQGEVLSADFLPRFAAQLGKELPSNLQTADAAFQRFQTALDDVAASTADGFMKELGSATDDLTAALKDMQQSGALEAIGSFLGDVIRLGGAAIQTIGNMALAWKKWRLEVGIKQAENAANGFLTSGAQKQDARARAFRGRLELDALNNPSKPVIAGGAVVGGGGGGSLPPIKPSGGGGGKKTKPPKSKLDPEAFAREEASLNDAILRFKATEAKTADERATLELQRVEAARVEANRDTASNERMTAAEKAKIVVLNDQLAALEASRIVLEQQADTARDTLDVMQGEIRNDRDLIAAQANIAETREERERLEMRLLDYAHEEERLALEAVKASRERLLGTQASADAEWQAAEARLAILGQIEKAEAEAIGRQYESPLEQRRRDVRETAANMGDAIENIELDAIDRLTDGLADASTEFIKLGGVAGDVLNSIIRDMVKLAAQKAIFGVGGGGPLGFLGGLLGGGSVLNAGSSGFDLSFGGARAGGGPVSAGKTYLVGEKGPELFTAPSDGNIVPNGMIDTSAARSMTGMAASSPAQGVNGTIRVALTMDNDVFTARVQEASVPVAVEVVRQNSPGLIQAAKAETMRDMGRPRL